MPCLRRPARRSFAVGAALVALASGCGGGGGASSASSTTLVTAPVSTTVPPPGVNQLKAIVIQPGDLPTGWKASPASPPADPRANAADFAQCMGAIDTLKDAAALAYSTNFASAASVISSAGISFKYAADVQADAASLGNPLASECFAKVGKARLIATLPKSVTVKSVALKITPGQGNGPAAVVATATGTVVFSSAGHTLTLKNEVVFLAVRRVEVQIAFYSTGNPVPESVKAAVVKAVAARMANAS
ncbi:MAG: hypothetical protein QOK39_2687 [Acidimicrobiaceae bacterium]|nr:hypothetical protein [Acidimicrobiaceae bacterium]